MRPTTYPCVVGHELAGIVTRVGKNVTKIKVGQRAGIGPQAYACGKCIACNEGCSNVCDYGFVALYNSKWPNGDLTYGGFSDIWRGHQHFVVRIPDDITNENACTMLCGGISSYAPLKRWNVKAGSVVGVMGIGGLGHFGVLFAKALGARVVAMSHSDVKRDVSLELGADEFLNTSDDSQMEKYKKIFTHILCTGCGEDFTWEKYIPTLKPNGVFINVSVNEWKFPEISPLLFIVHQAAFVGSISGSPEEYEEMFELVSKNNIKAWYQTYPMEKINEALDSFKANNPRFRYVLKN